MNVTAKDLGTGKAQSITITGHHGMSDAEIQKRVDDASSSRRKTRRFSKSFKRGMKQKLWPSRPEKLLKENADKVDEQMKADIEEGVANLRKKLEESPEDPVVLKETIEELEEHVHKLL